MKSLAVLVVFGCLVAESLGTRFHTKHDEVTINEIDENKARKLVTGIKAANPKKFTQYAVLCLVPISLGQPTYQDLTKVGFCTNAAYPSFDGQIHSEDKLLPRVNTLKTKYLKSATYKATQYDIFLFSYNSPCPRCAKEIVEAAKGMAGDNLFNGFYISYNQEYIYNKKSTLPDTKNTFKTYNDDQGNAKKITLLPEYHPLK